MESNGTTTQSFRVAVEPLTAYTGQELINWTCDKYGPPDSYTEAHIANRLYLVVDGRGNWNERMLLELNHQVVN